MKITDELREAAQRNFDGMKDSAVFCVFWHENMVKEVIPLIQMGLAVYLDKPIIVVVPKGRIVPMNVRSMALAVEEYDPDDPNAMRIVAEKVKHRVRRNG